MSFVNPTPLDDVLKYIEQASRDKRGLRGDTDLPRSRRAERGRGHAGISGEFESRRRVLADHSSAHASSEIGLAYCVRDGVLIISSAQGVNEELREAFNELKITHPDTAGGLDGGGDFVGGMQGIGGFR